MSTHLLALSLGPVQDLIAAARRTRDLWFGSHMLSEISKAAALAVFKHGGDLIFPAPQGREDLMADSHLNVSNVILAELRDGDPKIIAQAAEEAAKERWRQYAVQVFDQFEAVIRKDVWDEQVNDVIEFYAAWVEHNPGHYREDRARLMRLLAGRKNCRDFRPAQGKAGLPKSSLDGLRETVLQDPKNWPVGLRRQLRLAEGEQLDVVGLVKRTAEGKRPYPSVARVAADPWIRGLPPAKRQLIIQACEQINKSIGAEVIRRLDTTAELGQPHYAAFPFEGTAVYRSRHLDLRTEVGLAEEDLRPLADALREVTQKAGDPNPYLAVLVADGDRIGQILSRMESVEEHQQFSRKLSQFATEASRIVNEYNGVLVYSGGDDVLAFLPVDMCLEGARALHDQFAEWLSVETKRTGISLSLSVGIAIAHFMESLEDLLEWGRAAARHAKDPRGYPRDQIIDGGFSQTSRDGLAIHLHKRGGGPIAIRANWSDDPDCRLLELAEQLNKGAIPNRIAADLYELARVYTDWPPELLPEAIQRDTLRVIGRKQPRGSGSLEEVRELVAERVKDASSLKRLTDELLIARQLAIAIRQAKGQATGKEVSIA